MMDTLSKTKTVPIRLVIIGGGFTGIALAIHAIRANTRRLDITIVEPSSELGRGIAYSTRDPVHRINVPSDRMGLFADDMAQATRWFFDQGTLPDPASQDKQGQFFVSRYAFGTFMQDLLRTTIAAGEGVGVRHVKAAATAIVQGATGWMVSLDSGATLDATMVALCFGHARPHPPTQIDASVLAHPKFVADPWDQDALARIAPTDSVLIVGTGLTMADVATSLLHKNHRGPITALSRRGLLPRTHGLFMNDLDILGDRPVPRTALGLLRLLRDGIKIFGPDFGWHPVADSLRANLPVLWNALPPSERRRAVRRLLPFWEVHRFRIAPQIHTVLTGAIADGRLSIVKAALVRTDVQDTRLVVAMHRPDGSLEERAFDAIILCTGPDKDPCAHPLVARLIKDKLGRLDDANLGLAVDPRSRMLDGNGGVWSNLLAFGPMTRGSFGEMTGAPDISRHIEQRAGTLFDEIP